MGSARARPDVEVTGVDLARNMLATARAQFEAEGPDGRIALVEADIAALPGRLVEQPWERRACQRGCGRPPRRARRQLRGAGLGDLRRGHARPIPWLQAFWAPRADGTPGGSPGFRPDRLPPRVRGDAALLRSAFTAEPL